MSAEVLMGWLLASSVVGTVAFAVGYLTAAVSGSNGGESSSSREQLRYDSDYVEVVNVHDESGYGVAVRDMDLGPEVVGFNDQHEIYQEVTLNWEDVAPLADALSVRAAENRRVGGESA